MSNPYRYTLGTAAKQAGVAKSTLSRAIERGEISAIREGNGYRIDPAELDRWMGNRSAQPSKTVSTGHSATPSSNDLQQQIDSLKEIISAERRRADAAESDRDEWRKQAQTLALTNHVKRQPEAYGARVGGFFGWLGRKSSGAA
jgi:excisionase family DNA binding protein